MIWNWISLRFYDLDRDCPTHAGILLFGKNPLYHISGDYIQFVRFDGDDSSGAVLDEKKLSGDLLSLLKELDILLPMHIKQPLIQATPLQELFGTAHENYFFFLYSFSNFIINLARNASRISGEAFSGEPESKGGAGSYSIPS